MGYGGTALLRMVERKKSGVLNSVRRVMDVGAQATSATAGYVRPFLDAFCPRKVSDREVDDVVARTYTRFLWEVCGVEYTCIGLGEGLDCVHLDLNYDATPPKYVNAFDLVTNCGTTEHVINQLNSFRVIHEMTRPGGLMFHDVPWAGMSTHGFFNYKPTFFSNLAARNRYRWVGMWLRRQGSEQSIPLEMPLREFPNRFEMEDAMILIVFQKTVDAKFQLPMEVDGAIPAAFAARY